MQKREFIAGGENVVASYNWTDIAEGTGKVLFYGCADGISGSFVYNLLTSAVYSSEREGSTTTAKTWDFYSAPFNLPKNIKGTAYLNCCGYIDASSTMGLTVKLYHYRNGTSTAISSSILSEVVSAIHMLLIKIPITALTHFKKGDQIRLEITVTEFGAGTAAIGYEPKGVAAPNYINAATMATYHVTPELHLYIPFMIDL
jgi:predicted acyl esterase